MSDGRGVIRRVGVLLASAYVSGCVAALCFKGAELELHMLNPRNMLFGPLTAIFIPGANVALFLLLVLMGVYVVRRSRAWAGCALGVGWGILHYVVLWWWVAS